MRLPILLAWPNSSRTRPSKATVELIEHASQPGFGESLAGELVAGVLELLVVVDCEVENASCLVDMAADLLGM
jgi:hypothetical protein